MTFQVGYSNIIEGLRNNENATLKIASHNNLSVSLKVDCDLNTVVKMLGFIIRNREVEVRFPNLKKNLSDGRFPS